ncbi:hypothetical protein DK26_15150 [Bosea sp. WAO]|uniref:PepSY domain-containing protein n=1 Tax=Bosea sp. WAO TaxID=406341 RepID=UPI00074AC93D|nr:PepSY domain-containing protein [Bosea sp. WAO]KUL94343.1 hypothetical protein DK26_15150 [Bosea sp. WAO]
MKKLLTTALVAAMVPFAGMAQTPTTATTPTSPVDANAPLPGANSFTEGQAKSRLEANGYTEVSELKKDDNGVWKGSAMSAGAKVNVSVDYRGNVVRN